MLFSFCVWSESRQEVILRHTVNMDRYVNGFRDALKLMANVDNYKVQASNAANSYRQRHYSPTSKMTKPVINNKTPDETKTTALLLEQCVTKTKHQCT
jgi:hypothetical protein